MITCKACYYSETVRTLPSGCKYECGMGRGSEGKWRCQRVWSRCIREKDREIFGKVRLIQDSMDTVMNHTCTVMIYINFEVCAVYRTCMYVYA